MGILKKTIAVTVLFMMMIYFFPKPYIAMADQPAATKGKITEHDPKGRTTTEIDSPEKSSVNWLWALLGVAAIGGVVAALGGGGGGGGDDPPPSATGSFEATW